MSATATNFEVTGLVFISLDQLALAYQVHDLHLVADIALRRLEPSASARKHFRSFTRIKAEGPRPLHCSYFRVEFSAVRLCMYRH